MGSLFWYRRRQTKASFLVALIASLLPLSSMLFLFVGNPFMSECHHVARAREIACGAIGFPILITIFALIFCRMGGVVFKITIAMWLVIPGISWQQVFRQLHTGHLVGERRAQSLDSISLLSITDCAVGGPCPFKECHGTYSD